MEHDDRWWRETERLVCRTVALELDDVAIWMCLVARDVDDQDLNRLWDLIDRADIAVIDHQTMHTYQLVRRMGPPHAGLLPFTIVPFVGGEEVKARRRVLNS